MHTERVGLYLLVILCLFNSCSARNHASNSHELLRDAPVCVQTSQESE